MQTSKEYMEILNKFGNWKREDVEQAYTVAALETHCLYKELLNAVECCFPTDEIVKKILEEKAKL